MRVVIQRVSQAQVEIEDKLISKIGKGLLVYASVAKDDALKDAQYIAEKLVNLRIFPDQFDKMNRSLLNVGGAILLVSNFTLHGDCRKGRRPSFDAAAEPELARQLYDKLIELITVHGITVEKGIFGEHMHIGSINDGPVTFILDSK